ncbi:MAG: hypothetical protein QG608_215 [Actinomycetota bacterium]|nr:hypothetical protein [Actinomycetota bacterium]
MGRARADPDGDALNGLYIVLRMPLVFQDDISGVAIDVPAHRQFFSSRTGTS